MICLIKTFNKGVIHINFHGFSYNKLKNIIQ